MCISSVPRENSTFPGANFKLFTPPLSPKFMGKFKKKLTNGERREAYEEGKTRRNRKGEGRAYIELRLIYSSRGSVAF